MSDPFPAGPPGPASEESPCPPPPPTVLSDPGNQIAKALGVRFQPGENARAAQRELGLDTAVVNADGTGELPMPTVAFVDATGTLRWIDVHPNYTTRTEPTAILAAVDAEL